MSKAARMLCTGLAALVGLSGAVVLRGPALAAENAGSPASAIHVPLEFKTTTYSLGAEGVLAKPQNTPFRKEPAAGKNVRRGSMVLEWTKDKPLPFLWTSNRLYLDLNRNGDLTDDLDGVYSSPEVSGSRSRYLNGSFTNVKLSVPAEGRELSWLVDLNLFSYGDHISVTVQPRSFWSGKATLNGSEMEVGWIPVCNQRDAAKSDGRMLLRPWAERDRNFSTSDGSLIAFRFPEKLFYGEAFYAVRLEHTGGSQGLGIRLIPAEDKPALGELKLTGQMLDRVLLDSGIFVAVLDSPSGVVRVPEAGSAQCSVQVRKGSAVAVYKQPARARVTIKPNAQATLIAGGPLTNSVSIRRSEKTLILDYALLGAGGVPYEMLATDRSKPPRFAIYRNGKQIASGNFEYG